MGDSDFESPSFRYPVEVCEDCLVTTYPSCGALPTTIHAGGECNLYQDFALDCCVNSGGETICPAMAE